ncbi:MAG: tRNA (guanosine(37)-N1)-methyltransferase TrmD [Acidiferrobacterales bacterium]
MRVDIITLFPEMFGALTDYGITRRAVVSGIFELHSWNPRDYTEDKHRTVDDRPYGGGPGMVMMAEPVSRALQQARAVQANAKVIYLSPQGEKLNHDAVKQLSQRDGLILLAGRYEGIDERVIEKEVDEEWSIGDYVISGGELAAMVLIDAVVRQLPGALGDQDSAAEDSFVEGLLDTPHYTRPEVWNDIAVPDVLLSGDHAAIRRWRLKQALGRTWLRRPELLEVREMSAEESELLEEFKHENKL